MAIISWFSLCLMIRLLLSGVFCQREALDVDMVEVLKSTNDIEALDVFGF